VVEPEGIHAGNSSWFSCNFRFFSVYAASDEVHQSFVPGREMSILDWLADAAGILISGYVYYNRVFSMKKIGGANDLRT